MHQEMFGAFDLSHLDQFRNNSPPDQQQQQQQQQQPQQQAPIDHSNGSNGASFDAFFDASQEAFLSEFGGAEQAPLAPYSQSQPQHIPPHAVTQPSALPTQGAAWLGPSIFPGVTGDFTFRNSDIPIAAPAFPLPPSSTQHGIQQRQPPGFHQQDHLRQSGQPPQQHFDNGMHLPFTPLQGGDAFDFGGGSGDDNGASTSFALSSGGPEASPSSALGNGSAAGSQQALGGPGPRRRTRRRQNISCDQCRASKRGCDFQLKLDADGNDVTQGTATIEEAPTGAKRKAEGAEADGESGGKPVCSNCQRRGIECTTNFADSVRCSKQQAQAIKEAESANAANVASSSAGGGGSSSSSKRRMMSPDGSPLSVRSGSMSSEAGASMRDFLRGDGGSLASLSWIGPAGRFADRADSLSLTTDRMRLYVSTVEPNANLWLSRACSPLRTESDLGAFIKRAVASNSLDLSQKLWASWHVDSPSSQRDHQPNLFFLVFGLDHLGEEMSVWNRKLSALPSAEGKALTAAEAEGTAKALDKATREFHSRLDSISGQGLSGGARSSRDSMVDEAVKAAMLAYACQYRLDGVAFRGAEAANSAEEAKAAEAHDRVATAAWKKARSLLLQLAPRRSCRIAFGLFLFAVTAPPAGALAEGGINSGTDAAEDAAFAFETASRHLEWYIGAARDLDRAVDETSRNPILRNHPLVLRQKQMASDLRGLAESLGWFGLLIDTVSSVSLRRKSVMREDDLLGKRSGLETSLFGGYGTGSSPTSSSKSASSPDNTTAALFAIQDTLELLPNRAAPPGAFPGTSSSYLHEVSPDDNGQLSVDTEMSKRILERAACARDLIPALLRNPGAISKSIPFDVLLGAGDGGSGSNSGDNALGYGSGSQRLNEQVVLLGIAWGTAVEVYIWRRINALQTLSAPLLSATSPIHAYIQGGGTFVNDKKEKLVDNVLESIRLFHSIFDGLISKALDDYFGFTRQARSMLSMFVLHIHLGVLHFIRLAKDLEQKEVDLVQQFNNLSIGGGSSDASGADAPVVSPTHDSSLSGVLGADLTLKSSPGSATEALTPPVAAPPAPASVAGGSTSTSASPANTLPNLPNGGFTPLRSRLAPSSQLRRAVGKQAAVGMARVTRLMNLESSQLERFWSSASPGGGSGGGGGGRASPSPVDESGSAPWRHPYPLLLADALKLAAQQLHDEVWDQLLAVPRDEVEFQTTLGHLDTCLDGLNRLLHSVPALTGYRQGLEELRSARDTAAFVATQQQQ